MFLNNSKESQINDGLEFRDRAIHAQIKAATEQAPDSATLEEWIG
jgi:hypothetical protein